MKIDAPGTLLEKMSALKDDVYAETQRQWEQFGYTIHHRRIRFTAAVAVQNRKLAKKLARYLREAKIFSILTAPVIWSCLLPVLLLDLTMSLYQFICFPVYGIPKVRRADYIAFDRFKLGYLNILERINCMYCEYVNGFLAYAQEIAGRTEQYWCPIKHALRLKAVHSRYGKFFDYGDAQRYHENLKELSEDFKDLKK